MSNELDMMILKVLVSHKKHALDFANEYDTKLFSSEVWNFANLAVNYTRTYKELPTKRVMIEKLSKGNNEKLIEYINKIWTLLDNINYDIKEYKHDLDKIKKRYAEKQIAEVSSTLAKQESGNMDITKSVKEMQKVLQTIKSLNQVKAYDRKTLKEAVPIFREEYNAKMENPEFDRGVRTGYSYFDNVTDGLRPGELVLIGGESGAGKALPLETEIPTPHGMKLMRDIKAGDDIFGIDGKSYKVLAEGDVINSPGWKFTFDDGSTIISHENHEWFTLSLSESKSSKKPQSGSVKTTSEIHNSLFLSNGKANHYIPISNCLEFDYKDLPIDPYVLGCWLGNATSSKYGCDISRITKHNKNLKKLNLLKNKHIPTSYLFSSKKQRLDLLKGLIDSNAIVDKKGTISLSNTNKNIIDGISTLIKSLGEKCTVTEGLTKLHGKTTNPKWTVRFNTSFKKSCLDRKNNLQKNIKQYRSIVKSEKIENFDMKCIQVSSPDNLYLATNNFIPTHNSMLLMNMAIQLWMQSNTIEMTDYFGAGQDVLYFSLEMPFKPCLNRVLSRLSCNKSKLIRSAKLNAEEAVKLKKALKFINNYPHQFEIVDVPRGATMESLELIYEEAKVNYDPKFIVIDYMGLMDYEGQEMEDWLKLGKIAEKIHEFARVHNCTVLSAVQLNRSKGGKDPDDKIGLHRIGRSALILQNANIALQIETRANEKSCPDMYYHIIKNRDGELGKGNLIKNLAYGTLIDNKLNENKDSDESKDPDDISEKTNMLDI